MDDNEHTERLVARILKTRGIWRRTMIGLNAPVECPPGEVVQIMAVNTSAIELEYLDLVVPEIYTRTWPFDLVRFAIDGKDQVQGPIACSLLDRGLSGDPILPNGTILLEVVNRAPQGGLMFQAAIIVQFFERHDPPAAVDAPPAPAEAIPTNEEASPVELERVPGSTA